MSVKPNHFQKPFEPTYTHRTVSATTVILSGYGRKSWRKTERFSRKLLLHADALWDLQQLFLREVENFERTDDFFWVKLQWRCANSKWEFACMNLKFEILQQDWHNLLECVLRVTSQNAAGSAGANTWMFRYIIVQNLIFLMDSLRFFCSHRLRLLL